MSSAVMSPTNNTNKSSIHSAETIATLTEDKLSLGWSRYNHSCIQCQTPLVQPPPTKISSSMEEGEEKTEGGEKSRPGIPYCVICKSHVITEISMLSYVQELEDKHGDSWVTGSILMDILEMPIEGEDDNDGVDGNKNNSNGMNGSSAPNSSSQQQLDQLPPPQSQSQQQPSSSYDIQEARDELQKSDHAPPTHQMKTLHQKLLQQEQETEEYRIAQLRSANQIRLQKEDQLRQERMAQMKMEEQQRKEEQLRKQMEEIRISELNRVEMEEMRMEKLKLDEEMKLKEDEMMRVREEEELMTRVLEESSMAMKEDYAARRDIASKVLGAKMLQGYILKEEQCEKCEMPLMEKDSELSCVVCPVLAKKLAKAKAKKDKSKGFSMTNVSSSSSSSAAESNMRLKSAEAQITSLHAQKTLSQQFFKGKQVMQEIEHAKKGIFSNPSVEAAAKAQEAKFMAMLEDAKSSGIAEAKQENYIEQLAMDMAGPTFPAEELMKKFAKVENDDNNNKQQQQQEPSLSSSNTNAHPSSSFPTMNTENEDPTIIPMLEFVRKAKREALTPEEEVEIRFAEEERLQKLEQERKLHLEERHMERNRLQLENQRVEAIRLQKKAESEEALKELKRQEDLKKEQERLEELENQEKLKELQEKARLADEEKKMAMQAALETVQNPKSDLNEDNIIQQLEKAAEGVQEKAEKAANLAEVAMIHLSSVHKKIFHDSVDRATNSAVAEIEDVLAMESGVPSSPTSNNNLFHANSSTEVVDSSLPLPLLSKIADLKVGEEMKEYEKATADTSTPTPEGEEEFLFHRALTPEEWQTRRDESRKRITEMMMSGWTMVTEYCNGNQCRYSPLMKLDGIKKCAVCEGTGSGLDGAYTFDPNKGKPMFSLNKKTTETKSLTEEPKEASNEEAKTETDEKSVVETSEEPNEEPRNKTIESPVGDADPEKQNSFKKADLTIDTNAEPTSTPEPVTSPGIETITNPPLPPSVDQVISGSDNSIPKPLAEKTTATTPTVPPSSPLSLQSLTNSLASLPPSRKSSPKSKIHSKDFAEQRAYVSKEMGRKMLKGWNLLDKACPYCVMPLMTEKVGSEEVCVLCGPLAEKHKLEGQKQKELEEIKKQDQLKAEMEEMKMKKILLEKEEVELKMKLENEAEEKRKLEEAKREAEEKMKMKVDAEVKKREDEIKLDLKKAEQFVRNKNRDMMDDYSRNSEKERLVAERKRFAEIVNEVKKIEETRKKQEEEDSKSVNSRRSMASLGSRRSRSSAVPRISSIDDGDDASVGGVSIQFPPDFDYDDEDAIRQVIALAKMQKKNDITKTSQRNSSPVQSSSPPMSISFINKNNSSPLGGDSPRKRTPLLPRTPRLPPGGKSSHSNFEQHSYGSSPLARENVKTMMSSSSTSNHPTNDHQPVEEFDDGVSHISMGDNSSPIVDTQSFNKTVNDRQLRRERLLERLQKHTSSSSSSVNSKTRRSRAPSPSPRRLNRPTTPRSPSSSMALRTATMGSSRPRSSSLTRASSNRRSSSLTVPDLDDVAMTPTRRSNSERSESWRSKVRAMKQEASGVGASDTGSVQSSSSRRSSNLGDILSKIESAKAQLIQGENEEEKGP